MTDHPYNASQQMINQLLPTIILSANQHIKVKNLYFLPVETKPFIIRNTEAKDAPLTLICVRFCSHQVSSFWTHSLPAERLHCPLVENWCDIHLVSVPSDRPSMNLNMTTVCEDACHMGNMIRKEREGVCAAKGSSEVSSPNSGLYLRSWSLMTHFTAVTGLKGLGGKSESSTVGAQKTVRHRIGISLDLFNFDSVCQFNRTPYRYFIYRRYFSTPVWTFCLSYQVQECRVFSVFSVRPAENSSDQVFRPWSWFLISF